MDIESHIPLRVERYELREDAMAAGPCGSGYGDATLRSAAAIAADIADGLITEKVARGLFN